MPLFGKDAKLYYSATAYNGTNVPTDLTWIEMDKVQDHTDNFSPIEDDVTTRAVAAVGFAATAIVLSEAEISFTYVMDNPITGSGNDPVFAALWAAFQARTGLAMLTMSGTLTSTNHVGFTGNFSIGLNWQKNIRNKQLANFTAKVLQYPSFVTGSASL